MGREDNKNNDQLIPAGTQPAAEWGLGVGRWWQTAGKGQGDLYSSG